jgi:hypothetical protein
VELGHGEKLQFGETKTGKLFGEDDFFELVNFQQPINDQVVDGIKSVFKEVKEETGTDKIVGTFKSDHYWHVEFEKPVEIENLDILEQDVRHFANLLFILTYFPSTAVACDEYSTRMFELLRDKFGKDVFYEALETVGIQPGCYPEWPAALESTVIRMVADHGCCLWDRNGCSIWLEDITGEKQELDDRLEAWADRYSMVADIDNAGKWFVPCSLEELASYNEEGLMLAKEVRAILPDTTILTYARVMDDAFWGDVEVV